MKLIARSFVYTSMDLDVLLYPHPPTYSFHFFFTRFHLQVKLKYMRTWHVCSYDLHLNVQYAFSVLFNLHPSFAP
jgi:hypothetical protein